MPLRRPLALVRPRGLLLVRIEVCSMPQKLLSRDSQQTPWMWTRLPVVFLTRPEMA